MSHREQELRQGVMQVLVALVGVRGRVLERPKGKVGWATVKVMVVGICRGSSLGAARDKGKQLVEVAQILWDTVRASRLLASLWMTWKGKYPMYKNHWNSSRRL